MPFFVKDKGFTFVEVLIVLAIAGLVAIIIVPNYLRFRLNSNEMSAQETLRAIHNACESYKNLPETGEYPDNLKELSDMEPPLLDERFTSGKYEGYEFDYEKEGEGEFKCVASPIKTHITGTNVYFMDETGIIRLKGENGRAVES